MTSATTGEDLVRAICGLHTLKDAAYRDAWKKRGEVVGIVANIARKADRLENALDGAPDTPDETHLDTAIDLFVYAVKYRAYLADEDAGIDQELFGERPDGRGHRSDGPMYINDLLASYAGEAPTGQPLHDVGHEVIEAFNLLIDAVSDGAWAPVAERYRMATELADKAWRLVQAYALASPEAVEALMNTVRNEA